MYNSGKIILCTRVKYCLHYDVCKNVQFSIHNTQNIRDKGGLQVMGCKKISSKNFERKKSIFFVNSNGPFMLKVWAKSNSDPKLMKIFMLNTL